jgi:hypothetical protein
VPPPVAAVVDRRTPDHLLVFLVGSILVTIVPRGGVALVTR